MNIKRYFKKLVLLLVALSLSLVVSVSFFYDDNSGFFVEEIDMQRVFVDAVGDSETLDVDGWDQTYNEWTETGASPYLNAQDQPANIISVASNGKLEAWFDFEDTSFSGTIYVNLSIYCKNDDGAGNDYADVFVDYTGSGDGAGVGNIGQHTDWQYDTIDLGGHTVSEVNNLRVNFSSVMVTQPDDVYIDHAYLSVEGTAAGGNTEPTQSGEAPSNSSVNVSLKPDVYVIVTDTDGDTINATWYSNSSGSWVQFGVTNSSVVSGTNISQSFVNASALNTMFWWSCNISDGEGGYTNETYHFTTHPAPTQSDEAPSDGLTGIVLTPDLFVVCSDTYSDQLSATWWSNSSGGWVQFGVGNISFPSGTNISMNGANFTGYSTKYWWSVNCTDGRGGWVNVTYDLTTEANSVPAFSGESPVNESTGVGLSPNVYVVVTDGNNVTTCDFYTSLNGVAWTWRQTNLSVVSGTNITYVYSSANSYSTKYYWRVTANDGSVNVTSDDYEFTTGAEPAGNHDPVQSGESPSNNSVNVDVGPDLYVVVSDTDGDTMNATWWTNASGVWLEFASNSSVASGVNIFQFYPNFLGSETSYWWNVSVEDGEGGWCNETYSFTTERSTGGSGSYIVRSQVSVGFVLLFGLLVCIITIFVFKKREDEL